MLFERWLKKLCIKNAEKKNVKRADLYSFPTIDDKDICVYLHLGPVPQTFGCFHAYIPDQQGVGGVIIIDFDWSSEPEEDG